MKGADLLDHENMASLRFLTQKREQYWDKKSVNDK